MSDRFWYYGREVRAGNIVFRVYKQDDTYVSEHSTEAGAFTVVQQHNVSVLTKFEQAKLRGYAPQAM